LFCIVGLGNPGARYQLSRHNVGFIILDHFAEKHGLKFHPSKGEYFYSEGSLRSSDFFLIKPSTYMNNSGLIVPDILNNHKVELQNLLVLVDDINIELGKIRIRQKGSDGGHNGLKSIIFHLNRNEFARLRFGVGNKFDRGLQAEYVLNKFSNDELDLIKDRIEFSVNLVEEFISGGYETMSNFFSKSMKKKKESTSQSDEKISKEN
jgi:PTH1 family peptidyl-tRNA hydrolase